MDVIHVNVELAADKSKNNYQYEIPGNNQRAVPRTQGAALTKTTITTPTSTTIGVEEMWAKGEIE